VAGIRPTEASGVPIRFLLHHPPQRRLVHLASSDVLVPPYICKPDALHVHRGLLGLGSRSHHPYVAIQQLARKPAYCHSMARHLEYYRGIRPWRPCSSCNEHALHGLGHCHSTHLQETGSFPFSSCNRTMSRLTSMKAMHLSRPESWNQTPPCILRLVGDLELQPCLLESNRSRRKHLFAYCWHD